MKTTAAVILAEKVESVTLTVSGEDARALRKLVGQLRGPELFEGDLYRALNQALEPYYGHSMEDHELGRLVTRVLASSAAGA